MSLAALSQYRQNSVYGGAEDASPHKLVEMLYAGVLDRLATARGAIVRKDIDVKLRALSSALAIVEHLRLSLNPDAGGDIARNLEDLYDYVGRRLLHVNVHDDVAVVDELIGIVRELKNAWDGIAPAH